MNLSQLSVGRTREKISQTGNITGYEVEIEHKGLNEYK